MKQDDKRHDADIIPLDQEKRTVLDTATAAYHLNRRPQTLRDWACNENGDIRPLRIRGRLAWPVAELRRVLGLAAEAMLSTTAATPVAA